MSRIITQHIRPPIPTKAFDWSAVREDYDGAPDSRPPSNLIGHGPDEASAIADLLEREAEYEGEA